MGLILLSLLGQQPAPVMDAVVWPNTDAIAVTATCPQGVVRMEIVRFPTRSHPRVTELSIGGRRLPRAQTTLLDDALGTVLVDTIHVRECATPPDDRIRVQVRVERSYGAGDTRIELVTFFVKDDVISLVR